MQSLGQSCPIHPLLLYQHHPFDQHCVDPNSSSLPKKENKPNPERKRLSSDNFRMQAHPLDPLAWMLTLPSFGALCAQRVGIGLLNAPLISKLVVAALCTALHQIGMMNAQTTIETKPLGTLSMESEPGLDNTKGVVLQQMSIFPLVILSWFSHH